MRANLSKTGCSECENRLQSKADLRRVASLTPPQRFAPPLSTLTFTAFAVSRGEKVKTMNKMAAVCLMFFFAALALGASCGANPTPNKEAEIADKDLQSKTIANNLENNQLTLSPNQTKDFLLYNNGNTNLTVTGFLLKGGDTNAFSLVSAPSTTLVPGKENGVNIKIQCSNPLPSGSSSNLNVISDADNANPLGYFVISLFCK